MTDKGVEMNHPWMSPKGLPRSTICKQTNKALGADQTVELLTGV